MEDNIKIVFKQNVIVQTGKYEPGKGREASSSDHDNEPSVFIKDS
jgi:hypothetical protein